MRVYLASECKRYQQKDCEIEAIGVIYMDSTSILFASVEFRSVLFLDKIALRRSRDEGGVRRSEMTIAAFNADNVIFGQAFFF